jgi:hypothetical protein
MLVTPLAEAHFTKKAIDLQCTWKRSVAIMGAPG